MKKLFTTCAVLTIAALIVLSCKKSSNSTTSGSSSTSSTTGSTTGSTTSSAPFGGMFTVANIYNDNTLNGSSNDSTGSGTAQPASSTGTVNIGTVSVNTFTLGQISGMYTTTGASTVILGPFSGKPTWQITGGGGFGAFTFTTTKTIPHVENLHITSTAFSKSSNFVISHPSITADTIKYSITDDNGNRIIKSVVGSSSGVTFTASMMSPLFATSSNAVLQILGTVTEFSVQGGKNILFVSSSEYNKSGLAINP